MKANEISKQDLVAEIKRLGGKASLKMKKEDLKNTLEDLKNTRWREKYGVEKENAMEKEAEKLVENLVKSLTTDKTEEEATMTTENTAPATENVQNNNTENKEEKKMTKTAMNLIEKIQKLTPAYGDRLNSLSVADLKDLYRMLKDRANALANVTHSMENTALTGQYTDAMEALVQIVYNAIPECMRTSFTIHADPKKKKLMVRWSGKSMLFKVFIQKKNYKVHLKTKEAWNVVPFEHDAPFFQNGFNLPWAVKMNDDQFAAFLNWIFTTV